MTDLTSGLSGMLKNLYTGNTGETQVLESLARLLRITNAGDNFFLIPKFKVPSLTGPREIDIILLHPSFGLFIVEVKKWKDLDSYRSSNSPFDQVIEYRNLVLTYLQDKLGSVPINVEPRVIFSGTSSIEGAEFFEKNPSLTGVKNITFFQDDLESTNTFAEFFTASVQSKGLTKAELIKLAAIFVDKEQLSEKKDQIVPMITKDEVVYYDYRQLSVLSGYTEGFKVIRGVAGTGKTIILTNFVKSRLQQDPSEKFLVLAFNSKLADSLESHLADFDKNVRVDTLLGLFERIDFDWANAGGEPKHWDDQMTRLRSLEVTKEFRNKLRARLSKKPIDYFLCDETQDMPPNLMRVMYEEIHNCVFFVDEAQRFYGHSMVSIAEVFDHPDFPEKISLKGRVRHLKNVYRTPSNIAEAAFALLEHDTKLNDYYRKHDYLDNGFMKDIRLVQEMGGVILGDFGSHSKLLELVKSIPEDDVKILTHRRKNVKPLKDLFKDSGIKKNIDVLTAQSAKGLEAEAIVLHDFVPLMQVIAKSEPELLYRKGYVLLTRAKRSVYVSITDNAKKSSTEVELVLSTLKNYETPGHLTPPPVTEVAKNAPITKAAKTSNFKLADLMPSVAGARDGAELIVAASQIFAVITGLFIS